MTRLSTRLDCAWSTDREKNRFSARAARYARVGTNVGGVAARIRRRAGCSALTLDRGGNALATRGRARRAEGPDHEGGAASRHHSRRCCRRNTPSELQKLQSEAPPMGWAFVKRRMAAELGADWQKKFAEFEHQPAAAASLGQVHRAPRRSTASALACKLQYPDMQSAVEADLQQLDWLFAIHRRMDPVIDTSEIAKEIAARLREELDYRARGQARRALSARCSTDRPAIRVPAVWPELSTGRLLTLDWLDGHQAARPQGRAARRSATGIAHRDVHRLVVSVQPLRRDPRRSASRQLHGRSSEAAQPGGINLLDYGCIRIFPPKFVGGVVDLYRRPARRRRRSASCMPTRPGASRACLAS